MIALFIFTQASFANIWEESRDYKVVPASSTKAVLGPSAKISDGDVLVRLVIIPTTTSPGAVTIFDGDGDTGTIVFQGGATSVSSLASWYVDMNIRAKNAAANASGPRWRVSTGTNVVVLANGTFH